MAPVDLKVELITSLTSFLRVYSQRRAHLQRTSQLFTLTAARLHEIHKKAFDKKSVGVVFRVFGGVLGAACGVNGGLWGALGSVGAATCARYCGRVSAVGATVGFAGSVIGGVVGGVFSGAVGGAVCAPAQLTDSPVPRVVSDVVLFSIGCATGGAIGGLFGGNVGAAGGAVGGAFGALCATRCAVFLIRGIMRLVGSEESKEEIIKGVKVTVMEKSGDFREAIKPLVDELKTIKSISNKMAPSDVVYGVSAQTAKTLSSVTTMEKTISESQEIRTDLKQFVSSVDEAARQGRRVTAELEETKVEVETLLASLRE